MKLKAMTNRIVQMSMVHASTSAANSAIQHHVCLTRNASQDGAICTISHLPPRDNQAFQINTLECVFLIQGWGMFANPAASIFKWPDADSSYITRVYNIITNF